MESLEDLAAGARGVHGHDAAIRIAVAPLDEAALLHPVDDPGGAGDRYVELLGEAGHREWALQLEDRQDVDVDEAEGPDEEAPERRQAFLRIPGRHLIE